MATEQDKRQVLDFIQRVMKAAESGVLEDEQEGAKALGIRLDDWLDEHKTPRRKITTGIPILDNGLHYQDMTYRGSMGGARSRFYFSIAHKLNTLVCISPQEIEALYGKTTRWYAPHYGDKYGAGTYEYLSETDKGARRTSFSYTFADDGRVCLSAFNVSLIPPKPQANQN